MQAGSPAGEPEASPDWYARSDDRRLVMCGALLRGWVRAEPVITTAVGLTLPHRGISHVASSCGKGTGRLPEAYSRARGASEGVGGVVGR